MSMNSDTLVVGRGLAALCGILTPGRAGLLLASIVGLMVALWPLGLAGDYLNHLARNFIEARVWFDPVLQRNYAVSFALIPDLTMDMIVPWLSYVTGIYAAGAVTIWIAYVAPPLAGLLIAKTVHGRVTWVALCGFLVIFNENMQWGFVNFTASTGLALLGLALWMRLAPGWRRALMFAPFGAFLTLNHALGFLLFGYLVLLWEVGSYVQGHRGPLWTFLRQLLTGDALAMVPGLALVALSTQGAQELTNVGVTEFEFVSKLNAIWAATTFFSEWLARLTTIVLLCLLWIGAKRGIIGFEPRMAWLCGGMLVLVIAMPTSILGIWGLHFRYPAVLFILVACGIRFAPDTDARALRPVAGVLGAIILAVFVNGAIQTWRIDESARSLRESLAVLPEGARLLTAWHEQADIFLAFQFASLAVIERAAFVPNLFTNTSPVDVRPDMRALHLPQAWPLSRRELVEGARKDLPDSANGYWSYSYFHGWPKHWDYVLYFRSDEQQSLDLGHLCPVDERPGFALYEVSAEGLGD